MDRTRAHPGYTFTLDQTAERFIAADDDLAIPVHPQEWWTTHRGGPSPIVGTAIHNGHSLREDLVPFMALDREDRLREEDPYTEFFIRDLDNRIVFHRSRFEVDINRAREGAIYLKPAQAWGLNVWRDGLEAEAIETSLGVHDAYYEMLKAYLAGVEAMHGGFIVLDIHSYNHRREGPDGPEMPFDKAPQINIGTSSMDRKRWAPVIDAFIKEASRFTFRGRPLDVRENIAFQGKGEQTRFVHEHFPQKGCAIAIEFKKFFMDEWTAEPDLVALTEMRAMIAGMVPVLEDALRGMK
ncbi:hypothetical protein QO002_004770 [Pararhizobium capsulatum DSM 1112]|uniref:N-formylglutamate amidohydrolase n=1 Tax=Pararhizobium capsulatum DSM 1112 TaxID=1121113 RepID=A0ABU0BWC7_9HYPH|nr:N-formylglutamate amidohydrolase [Pararhizobium capsulatum]MDQ0322564.1 hypothetical protein [Pararhizobium capsulatum DSM 1112]